MELSKKIFWYSITATTSISFAEAQVTPQDSSEKICPLHQDAEREQTQQPPEGSADAPTSSDQTEQKNNDDASAKRVLKYFSQVVLHFLSLLSDPKNPAVVKPNLNGMFTGMVSIFMEALRKGRHTPEYMPMPEKHAALAQKINTQIKLYGRNNQ